MISAPTVDYIIRTDASNLELGAHDEDQTINTSVIRQKGESQNGCFK